MKIFLTGAQGTGKTTILDKIKYHPLITSGHFEIVTSVSRKLQSSMGVNLKGGENTTFEMQQRIFDAYETAFSGSKNILADRSLYDVTAYTKHILSEELSKLESDSIDADAYQVKVISSICECQQYLCRQFERQYKDNIIYFYFPIEFDIVDDGTRSVNPDFQKEIDKSIVDMINESDVTNIYTVSGSISSRTKFVEKVLESKMT